MSLLMDALRKAEASKQQAEQEENPESSQSGDKSTDPSEQRNPLESAESLKKSEGQESSESRVSESPEKNSGTAKTESSGEPDVVAQQLSQQEVPAETISTHASAAAPSAELEDTIEIPGEVIIEADHESNSADLQAASSSKDSGHRPASSIADLVEKYGRSAASAADVKPAEIELSAVSAEATLDKETDEDKQSTDKLAEVQSEEKELVEVVAIESDTQSQLEEVELEVASVDETRGESASENSELPELQESIEDTEQPEPATETVNQTEDDTSETDQNIAKSVFQAKRPGWRPRSTLLLGFLFLGLCGSGAYLYFLLSPDASIDALVQRITGAQPLTPAISATPPPAIATPQVPVQVAVSVGNSENNVDAPPISEESSSVPEAEISAQEPVAVEIPVEAVAALEESPVESQDSPALAVQSPEPLSQLTEDQAAPILPEIAESAADESASSNMASDNESAVVAADSAVPQIFPSLEVAAVDPVNLISFSRRESASDINPLIIDAYNAYQNGNLDEADSLYSEVLLDSPYHRDALLGLAGISIRREDNFLAMEYYSRLLTGDPSDPVAQAGLLELTPRESLAEQERELRRLIRLHPQVATLTYALGNVYASQARWRDAQAAYFNALQMAKAESSGEGRVNPDYAFNLAVSLEHLGQLRPALNYYEEALSLAGSFPQGFNLSDVRSRVSAIEESLNP